MEAPTSNPREDECVPQASRDLASYVQEQKRALRAQFTIRAMTAEERQIAEDAHWALGDPQVQADYRGEFVVPWRHTIVAHGHDAARVLEEAARILGREAQDLALVGVIDPFLDMPH